MLVCEISDISKHQPLFALSAPFTRARDQPIIYDEQCVGNVWAQYVVGESPCSICESLHAWESPAEEVNHTNTVKELSNYRHRGDSCIAKQDQRIIWLWEVRTNKLSSNIYQVLVYAEQDLV